jgi:large subunit ribosomal protein L18
MLTKDRAKRKKRVRGKISGTAKRPRLAVFKSSKYIYAQLINDDKKETIVEANTRNLKSGSKLEKAQKVGEELAKKAAKKKIKQVVFDRGGFRYHGRVKALAEGARKGGLKF